MLVTWESSIKLILVIISWSPIIQSNFLTCHFVSNVSIKLVPLVKVIFFFYISLNSKFISNDQIFWNLSRKSTRIGFLIAQNTVSVFQFCFLFTRNSLRQSYILDICNPFFPEFESPFNCTIYALNVNFVIIFTNPSTRAGCDTRSILKPGARRLKL